MKLHIDKEANALYLRLDNSKIIESEEVSPGIVLDYNDRPVGLIFPKSHGLPDPRVVRIFQRPIFRRQFRFVSQVKKALSLTGNSENAAVAVKTKALLFSVVGVPGETVVGCWACLPNHSPFSGCW